MALGVLTAGWTAATASSSRNPIEEIERPE